MQMTNKRSIWPTMILMLLYFASFATVMLLCLGGISLKDLILWVINTF